MKRMVITLIVMLSLVVSSNTAFASEKEWECPQCGNVSVGNFCSNCGEQNPQREWKCTNCGEIVSGNFCSNCGNSKPEETPDQSEVDNSIIGINNIETLEGPGFETPEEAVLAYLDGLNNGNVFEMISTFAIESFADHNNPEETMRFRQGFNEFEYNVMPVYSGYAKEILRNWRYSSLVGALSYQYAEVSTQLRGMPKQIKKEDELHEVLDLFANSPVNQWVGNVEFVEWIDPFVIFDSFEYDRVLSSLAASIAISGGDDGTELAAHIKLNGGDAIQFMRCIQYGDKWFNLATYGSSLSLVSQMDSYSNGLLYPHYEGEEYIDAQTILSSAEYYSQVENEIVDSWEESGLIGTQWKLRSAIIYGTPVNVVETPEETLSGMNICANLKFMHLGGSFLDIYCSPAASGLIEIEEDPKATYSTAAYWDYVDSTLRFGNCKRVGVDIIDLSSMQCLRNKDTLVIGTPDDMELTFYRAQ